MDDRATYLASISPLSLSLSLSPRGYKPRLLPQDTTNNGRGLSFSGQRGGRRVLGLEQYLLDEPLQQLRQLVDAEPRQDVAAPPRPARREGRVVGGALLGGPSRRVGRPSAIKATPPTAKARQGSRRRASDGRSGEGGLAQEERERAASIFTLSGAPRAATPWRARRAGKVALDPPPACWAAFPRRACRGG